MRAVDGGLDSPRRIHPLCAAIGAVFVLGVSASPVLALEEPVIPLPTTIPAIDKAKVDLGTRLFSDTRLSRAGNFSCAGCHPLEASGARGRWVSMPAGSTQRLVRDAPTVFNAALNISFNWDGSGRTLEEVIDGVVKHRFRFDTTWDEIVSKLRSDEQYVKAFEAAYGEAPSAARARDALVVFQRTLITPNSRFDRYLRGDNRALTRDELAGYSLFKSFGCAACHQGVNVGGNLYQRFGVFRDAGVSPDPNRPVDLGRFWLTKVERDRGVFRVPSLRNVEVTAPYFHDGRAATLHQAVQFMAKVQLDRELTSDDTESIVRFLRTLTGEYAGRRLTPLQPTAAFGDLAR